MLLLADPDWRVRAAAHARLEAAGARAWVALANACRCPDAEVRRRAGDILRPYRDRAARLRREAVVRHLVHDDLSPVEWLLVGGLAWDAPETVENVLAHARSQMPPLVSDEEVEEYRRELFFRGEEWRRLLAEIRRRALP